jgi:hypothetical protein
MLKIIAGLVCCVTAVHPSLLLTFSPPADYHPETVFVKLE